MEFPTRTLPDGRILTALPLTFGRGRLGVSPPGEPMWFTTVW